MIDIKAVYSSDAFSSVTGPSSAIARDSSIAEYGHPPTSFHHIVSDQAAPGAAASATLVMLAIAMVDACDACSRHGIGHSGTCACNLS
jgi:hypothetical protein